MLNVKEYTTVVVSM